MNNLLTESDKATKSHRPETSVDTNFLQRFKRLAEMTAALKLDDNDLSEYEIWLLEQVGFVVALKEGWRTEPTVASRFVQAINTETSWKAFASAIMNADDRNARLPVFVNLVRGHVS